MNSDGRKNILDDNLLTPHSNQASDSCEAVDAHTRTGELRPRLPFVVDPLYGCWLFTGCTDAKGYGRIKGRLAHRIAYEQTHGAIPANKPEIDHRCRRRACLRHLEPVTRRENERRKNMKYRSKVKRCPNGHDLAYLGILTPEGGKLCRTCDT